MIAITLQLALLEREKCQFLWFLAEIVSVDVAPLENESSLLYAISCFHDGIHILRENALNLTKECKCAKQK